ncbi:alkaline phosphatase [Candidatus Roizmanbacteria bacterium CG03_land_8_20_14_0_80_35_26]|uniref:Alkaline phosphatase n=2 Tax=Candidatus Roizmaniibacteriota TaxID=1752723 RepID=A0A2M7BY07_9BACT|nr:MAG: alkaline phosphatase [Candidatus Roizmanbacteria bacterium CG11_big_fil_rev_8_21_14_0_20_35_14]PIV11463.1 MAG: alkaline phosphatase [Candidatus Roizmanbacteria bacterium CG03_land_8_20_14_0_80_35_26]
MIEQIITFFTGLIISVISKTGYFGIFGLMAAESALIPIPSEVTMPFAGYLASVARFNIYLVILVGALANLFGSILAYWLGYWGEDHVIRQLIKKYGKYLLMTEHEYERSERWFRKYGEKITFFSRILPIVRTFISLPAGVAKMNFWKFSFFTFFGSLIWSGLLAYIGFVLGKNWYTLSGYYRKFEYLIVFAVLALGIYYIVHKLQKLRKK